MRQTVLDLGKKRARERGGILVIAIIVILAMLILAIPFLFKLSAENRSTERAARALSALNLAEAGVDKVMWELDPNSSSEGDLESIHWDRTGVNDVGVIDDMKTSDNTVIGDVHVVLTPPVGVAPNPQTRTLTSTGLIPFIAANTVDRSVRVTLERYYKSIFDFGFFVDDYFYISAGFHLDTYDSREGPYGDPNWRLPANFGTNSYIADTGHGTVNPGDASWTINGGGSKVWGSVWAGGNAADDYINGVTTEPPDSGLLDSVINAPDNAFVNGADESKEVMTQKYDLPSVDVFYLPPKEILGNLQSVGSWFDVDNSGDPTNDSYYAQRLLRAPFSSEIVDTYEHHDYVLAAGGTDTLTAADSGVYTSFIMGDDPSTAKGGIKGGCTLNIQGNVTIYVTEVADNPGVVGRLIMGPDSNINIIPQADGTPSSLNLILGNTSFVVQQGYNINQNAGTPANCVILGTDQFTLPQGMTPENVPKLLKQLDDTPGLMWFEHGQSDGNIYAAIYVPRADFAGAGQGENHMTLYGACISKYMDFKTQIDFHYDKALADLEIFKGGYEFWKIINWAEVVGAN